MFEELQNNQENKVDDIFAESEKGSSAQDPRMINQNPNQNPMMLSGKDTPRNEINIR